jgi:phage shock protein E
LYNGLEKSKIMILNFLKALFGFGSTDNTALIEVLKSSPTLIDVRTPAEFNSGSVDGAINIPLDTIPSRLNELKSMKNIVVFCRSGNRSGMAKDALYKAGITDLVNGGTWQNVRDALLSTQNSW